ncbi:MAG: 1-deoxy-D-xylulose-5-phosphate synthase [Firmicutes bacterium]|nr:1-deoxy-D-xylulose-5-phosphate synthase [Bacillota bacterium]
MSNLLSRIQQPSDLKQLSDKQLNELAAEIRKFLLKTVAQTGGHLASNLGVVELTLALHTVFDSPIDQIIWDVGHQSYIHKMLTGRFSRFETLRQYNGLSGFPKPEESVHDAFGTGHSSTSISAAIGLAKARDLMGENNKVVAVIGDGSLTGGMAFEALNHLGHLQTDLIIVLNDNEMSISKNVGALSRYLTRLRLNPKLRRLKADVQDILQRIPRLGQATVRTLEKLEDSIRFLVTPGMLFEELGIAYFGPVDGHNISDIKFHLKQASIHKGPVLIHVLTTKGKGYELAEKNPQHFHGTGPFEITNGKKIGGRVSTSYTEVFAKTIVELARENSKILAITAAMTDGTGLINFAKEFPERFFDVGIAEEHAVTLAAGFAKKGFRPVVAVYSTFLQRAYDQIVHDVCLQKLPVLFMLDRAGLVGPDGPTHHGVFDLSYLRHIPNMVIMAPKDGRELRDMLATALAYNGPAAIRYPKRDGLKPVAEDVPQPLPFGRSELIREGEKIALIGVGSMVEPALEAALRLQKYGINCTVVNARFVKPLDEELILRLAESHPNIVTIEENVIAGGFGSAVLEFLVMKGVRVEKFKMLGLPDQFVTHGATEILLEKHGLSVEGICRAVREMVLPTVGIRAGV